MSNIGYTHSAMYEGQISNAFKRFWSAKKQQLGTKNYVNNDYNSAGKESKPDWVEVESEDGRNTFFHNVITKEALWERPTNEDVRLLDGTTLKCKKNIYEKDMKSVNEKRNVTRFFLYLKGVEASITIQSLIRGYLTRLKVLQSHGYELNTGSSLFEDHPIWQGDIAVQRELKAIGIGVDTNNSERKNFGRKHIPAQNMFSLNNYDGNNKLSNGNGSNKIKHNYHQTNFFQHKNDPEPIMGYQFGHDQKNTSSQNNDSNSPYHKNKFAATRSPESISGNESRSGNNNHDHLQMSFDLPPLHHHQSKSKQMQPSTPYYRNRIDSIDSSDSDIDSFDQKFTILETSRQKVHRHRYHNHEHTTANIHHLSPVQPPVNISPMRHFHKNKSSPVVHQHRRLKKWTRGGKAIDIIPDSNYTRVENRKKRNHPKNINYIREGRMEKDIRTESASSSDSYLSRYLASRNSTPGTSR